MITRLASSPNLARPSPAVRAIALVVLQPCLARLLGDEGVARPGRHGRLSLGELDRGRQPADGDTGCALP